MRAQTAIFAGVVGLGLSVSLTSPAAPPTGASERIAVLPLEAPELAAAEGQALKKAVMAGLARGNAKTASVDPPGQCGAKCLTGLAANVDAEHLVQVSVKKTGPDWLVLGRIFNRNGADTGVSEATCEICGTAELAALVEDVAAGLAAEVAAAGRSATLVLTGDPVGATVSVDGVAVGTTPFEGLFSPGKHEILISAPGYGEQKRKWTGKEGVSESLAYTLAEDVRGTGGRVDGEASGLTTGEVLAEPFGWLGIGFGTATIASGAVMLGIHGRDHAQTCVPGIVDADGDCPFTYQTLIPGAVLVGAGAALLGAGIAGVVIGRKKKNKARANGSSAKPEARLHLGPASIELGVRF